MSETCLMSRHSLLSEAGKRGGSAPKHNWQEWEEDTVRRDYDGTTESVGRIAARLNVSFYAVKGRVQKLGLAMQKSPPWTEQELELLEGLIHKHSVTAIAKRLHRSVNAVKIKATRLKLHLRSRDDWFTKKEVAEICGVDHKKVQHWIDQKALRASWHNGRRPQKNGMAMWHIDVADFKDFLLNYSEELLGRNVDIQTIIWIVGDKL